MINKQISNLLAVVQHEIHQRLLFSPGNLLSRNKDIFNVPAIRFQWILLVLVLKLFMTNELLVFNFMCNQPVRCPVEDACRIILILDLVLQHFLLLWSCKIFPFHAIVFQSFRLISYLVLDSSSLSHENIAHSIWPCSSTLIKLSLSQKFRFYFIPH